MAYLRTIRRTRSALLDGLLPGESDTLDEDQKKYLAKPVESDLNEATKNRSQAALDRYITSLAVADYYDAKYSVNYPKQGPVMKNNGSYLYFKDKKKALEVQQILKNIHHTDTEVCFGPKATMGRAGQIIQGVLNEKANSEGSDQRSA